MWVWICPAVTEKSEYSYTYALEEGPDFLNQYKGLLDMRINNSKLAEGALPGHPNTVQGYSWGNLKLDFLFSDELKKNYI